MESAEQLPNSLSLGFVEDLYLDYLRDPSAVPDDWRVYFERLSNGDGDVAEMRLGPSFKPRSVFNADGAYRNGSNGAAATVAAADERGVLQERVDQLVRAYRERGHLEAQLDPLGMQRARVPELDLTF